MAPSFSFSDGNATEKRMIRLVEWESGTHVNAFLGFRVPNDDDVKSPNSNVGIKKVMHKHEVPLNYIYAFLQFVETVFLGVAVKTFC